MGYELEFRNAPERGDSIGYASISSGDSISYRPAVRPSVESSGARGYQVIQPQVPEQYSLKRAYTRQTSTGMPYGSGGSEGGNALGGGRSGSHLPSGLRGHLGK